jgi:hypothetical protein
VKLSLKVFFKKTVGVVVFKSESIIYFPNLVHHVNVKPVIFVMI